MFVDNNGNNTLDPGEPLLSGVTIYLLDGSGNRIATTTTDENGKYSFTDLDAGRLRRRGSAARGLSRGRRRRRLGGRHNSTAPTASSHAQLDSGVDGVSYDFWEIIPAKISGYVFQDGPAIVINQGDPTPNIPALRDGKLTADDTRLSGVTLELCDASGVPLLDSGGNKITTKTDANGYYQFTCLRRAQYSILEIQPAGYIAGRRYRRQQRADWWSTNTRRRTPASSARWRSTPSDSAIVRISIESGRRGGAVQFQRSAGEDATRRTTRRTTRRGTFRRGNSVRGWPRPTPLPPAEYQPVMEPYYLDCRTRSSSRSSAAGACRADTPGTSA